MTQLTFRRLIAGVTLALAAAIALGLAARAQDQTGCEMSGYVLDPQGRGVPSADVMLKISGRPGASRVLAGLDGAYAISVPTPVLEESGYVYVKLPNGDTSMIGHVNFKRCRTRRDIFTNEPGAGYVPGPTPPAPPPILPAYPAPDAPRPALENAVAFFDLTALPRGGVSPGDTFNLPVCMAAFSSPAPQISKVTFIGEFPPEQVQVASDAIRTVRVTAGQQVLDARVAYQTVAGRQRGRIVFSVEFNGLVNLPELPNTCIRVADVTMFARPKNGAVGVEAGDTVGFSTVKDSEGRSSTMRIGTEEGIIARSTSYLDILTAEEQQDILKRSYIPLLVKERRLR